MHLSFRSKIREKLIMEHVGERQSRHMMIIIHRKCSIAAQLLCNSHVALITEREYAELRSTLGEVKTSVNQQSQDIELMRKEIEEAKDYSKVTAQMPYYCRVTKKNFFIASNTAQLPRKSHASVFLFRERPPTQRFGS